MMWAPGIYDYWESPDKKFSFESFALITDDPPQEIKEAGHGRCPIFIEKTKIDDWLKPQEKSTTELLNLLAQKETAHFSYS